MANRFESMSDLYDYTGYTEGVSYRTTAKKRPSPYSIIAIHGGAIEPGTTELAKEIAGSTHSFYTFEGLLITNNYDNLHVSSNQYDSPLAIEVVGNSEYCISIHNASIPEEMPCIYVGGQDRHLRNSVWYELTQAGFNCVLAPYSLLGTNDNNICNRTLTGMGVQLENNGYTSEFFEGGLRGNKKLDKFYAYTNAITRAINNHERYSRLGNVDFFPMDNTLRADRTADLLEIDLKIRDMLKGLQIEAIGPNITPNIYGKEGIYSFYLSDSDSTYQSWMDSLGITDDSYPARDKVDLRLIVLNEFVRLENGVVLGKQTATVFDWGSGYNFKIWGEFKRATNNATLYNGIWGQWQESVFVIEKGSNENGSFIRYSDGAQICKHTTKLTSPTLVSAGTHKSETYTWTFPVPFNASVEPIDVDVQPRATNRWGGTNGSALNASCTVCMFHASDTPSTFEATTLLTARGRWR